MQIRSWAYNVCYTCERNKEDYKRYGRRRPASRRNPNKSPATPPKELPESNKKSSVNDDAVSMIRLEETKTEYLVAIPADQKERAKKIKPRYWHVGQKRWVYPPKPHVYRALIAEFGPDADVVDITLPESGIE